MSILDQWQSIFQTDPKEESIVEIGSPAELNEAPQPVSTDNQSVLWGTAATAAIGAAIAYAQEEKRKREEEKARQAELEEQEEERREKAKERHMEKMEEKRAQEQAWEDAREEQEARRDSHVQIDMKMDRIEMEEAERRIVAQIEAREQAEEKKFLAAEKTKDDEFVAELSIHYDNVRSGEKDTSDTKTNWWEKTKSFFSENIIQPIDTYVYQPYVKPVLEKTEEVVTKGVEWMDDNIYQPQIKPAIEKTKEFLTNESAWINEKIYEPYIKPAVDRTKEFVVSEGAWINEHIYQPAIQPIVEKVSKTVTQGLSGQMKTYISHLSNQLWIRQRK